MIKYLLERKRAGIYGTYQIQQLASDPTILVKEINRCKDYCFKQGYHVTFTHLYFERRQEATQGESMEFRSLLQAIAQDELDLVLFVDFAWISRKPEQEERLRTMVQAYQTTLIDVNSQQIIFRPL